MSSEHSTSYRASLLTTRKLRELIRQARGGFAPDHVARMLRYQLPEMLDEDCGEMAELLLELAADARNRLNDAGIEPLYKADAKGPKLPKREREYVANLGVLFTILSAAEGSAYRPARALEHAEEGIAWCRAGGDQRQESILWRVLSAIYLSMNDVEKEERAACTALEVARLSGDPEQIVEALGVLCSFYIVRFRLDDAEPLNEEGLAIAREQLKEKRDQHYASLLMNSARIMMQRTHYTESIRTLREALRWADADTNPIGRAHIQAHLGSVYLRLDHIQQSIECQHEVVRLGATIGRATVRGWGYYRLAEAHLRLHELDQTEEMLDRAEECAVDPQQSLPRVIAAKRAALLLARKQFDEAAALCRKMLEDIGDDPYPDVKMFAFKTLADIELQRERYSEAEEPYRSAIAIAQEKFPARVPLIELGLADVLLQLGRDTEVALLLGEIGQSSALNPPEHVRLLRLSARAAENRGELREALNCEREAIAIEREILERNAEQSLRNARIIAETDLREREVDLERERRRRVERELAEAVVELGDRKRLVDTVELRLRGALEKSGAGQDKMVTKALRETLAELRAGACAPESPLRYLNGVDEDFYRRLRQSYPDLTSKQERLCGLLRAGLSSKEIGTLMGLEAEGLKAQRKRLRKRMGLHPEEKLETLLATV